MSNQLRATPKYRFVNGEADIADLIPGDRVKVSVDSRSRWMAYGGHRPTGLSQSTKCTFIDIPEGYNGGDVDAFRVWESSVRYLQFPGNYIEFDSHHRQLRAVNRGTEEYLSVKPIVDALITIVDML